MRIVKSNKTVKASEDKCSYDYWQEEVMDERLAGMDSDDKYEEYLKWKKTQKCDDVKGCRDVKASKKLSANDQALQHIKAAIDILGKSGQKDAVTKDTIANLGVVMFDLKGRK